jgi:UDP-2,3-diacylglucosamine hydrolase
MTSKNKIYFASDMHFGAPDSKQSLIREKLFVSWLNDISADAEEIFLLGDVFDFWFEYTKVIPKGFTRLLGKLAEITDNGTPIHFFTGNHDLWANDYLNRETGLIIHSKPMVVERQGKRLLIGHGDGLGPGDRNYKRMKKVFLNPLARWLFRWVHPDAGVALAQYLSLKNRYISGEEMPFTGEDEALVRYCRMRLNKEHFDYFIFGHRHLVLEYPLNDNSSYINTGDWLNHKSYAVLFRGNISLQQFDDK